MLHLQYDSSVTPSRCKSGFTCIAIDLPPVAGIYRSSLCLLSRRGISSKHRRYASKAKRERLCDIFQKCKQPCMKLLNLLAWQVERQQIANPKGEGEEPYRPLAPVLENSVNWGGFMALSTNIRYQVVNGFEDRILVRMLLVMISIMTDSVLM